MVTEIYSVNTSGIAISIFRITSDASTHKHKYVFEVVDLSVIKFHVNEGLLQRQSRRGIKITYIFWKLCYFKQILCTFLCELRIASRISWGWKFIRKRILWLFLEFSCVQNIISPRPNIVRAEVINCLSFLVALLLVKETQFALPKLGWKCS